jgi:hypothetical protein
MEGEDVECKVHDYPQEPNAGLISGHIVAAHECAYGAEMGQDLRGGEQQVTRGGGKRREGVE